MSRRRIVKRFAIVAAVLVAVVLAVGSYASYQWNRLVITIRHEGPANVPATNIQLSVRGDRVVLEQLQRGEHRNVVLKPQGESGIELTYKLGNEQCRWGGGYVEPAGGYRVVLEIRGCGDIREHTSTWP
jgi:hypothetical protein